jgi:hypothetical protein
MAFTVPVVFLLIRELSRKGEDQSSMTKVVLAEEQLTALGCPLVCFREREREREKGGERRRGRRNGWRDGSFSPDKKKQLCLPNCAFIPPIRSCIQQLSSSLHSSHS